MAGELQTSALTLLSFLKHSNRTTDGETARLQLAQFEAKAYFKAGDDESLTQLAASTLRDDFKALPPDARYYHSRVPFPPYLQRSAHMESLHA